jgi:hypothetical protein
MARFETGGFTFGLLVAVGTGAAWLAWSHGAPPVPPQPLPIAKAHLIDLHTSVREKNRFSADALAPLPNAARNEAYDPNEQLPADALVLRAQPSVFKLLIMGKADRVLPKTIALDTLKLDIDYAVAEQTGTLVRGESKEVGRWRIVAGNPGRYLKPSSEMVTSPFKGFYGHGTAFAVSREGIFLTNAHMTPSPDEKFNPEFALGDFIELVNPWTVDLQGKLGDCPDFGRFGVPILLWFKSQCHVVRAQLDHLELVLAYTGDPGDDTADSATEAKMMFGKLSGSELEKLKDSVRRPITRRCAVLAKGSGMPGKDVAVIQVLDKEFTLNMAPLVGAGGVLNAEHHMFEVSSEDRPGNAPNARDRFICLPLGDSDAVLPATAVQAMGFAGVGFNAAIMDESASYRVSAENGQISNTRRMRGGYEAFEMTAEINHGDSGGPVIDRHGRVIAINMGSANSADTRGHTLAVPINLAKDLLKSAGVNITPDPGPLTQKWVESVRLFCDGKYSDAARTTEAVEKMQQRSKAQAEPGMSTVPGRTNPYVEDLHRRALKMAAK